MSRKKRKLNLDDTPRNELPNIASVKRFLDNTLDDLLDQADIGPSSEVEYTTGYYSALNYEELDDEEDYSGAYLSGFSAGETLREKGYSYLKDSNESYKAKHGGTMFNCSSRKKFIK